MPTEEQNVLWQKQARDLGGDHLVAVIEGMGHDISSVKRRLDMVDKHMKDAFPNGDLEGHRLFHDAMISRTREIRALKIVIRDKTLAGLVWSAMMFIGWCIWSTIKQKLGYGI